MEYRPDDKSFRLIANPDDFEKLRRLGYNVDAKPPTMEERVAQRFSAEQAKEALERAKKLPPRPDIAAPSVLSLYDEAAQCIVVGLYGAAITLSSNLIEYTMKYCIYTCRMGGSGDFQPDKWAEVERVSFEPAIRQVSKLGLITKKQNKILYEFMKEVRDPYNHYNLQKIVKGSGCEKVQLINIETGETEERSFEADEDLVLAAQVKPFVDQANVFRHFEIAHQVVCTLYASTVAKVEGAEP